MRLSSASAEAQIGADPGNKHQAVCHCVSHARGCKNVKCENCTLILQVGINEVMHRRFRMESHALSKVALLNIILKRISEYSSCTSEHNLGKDHIININFVKKYIYIKRQEIHNLIEVRSSQGMFPARYLSECYNILQ